MVYYYAPQMKKLFHGGFWPACFSLALGGSSRGPLTTAPLAWLCSHSVPLMSPAFVQLNKASVSTAAGTLGSSDLQPAKP